MLKTSGWCLLFFISAGDKNGILFRLKNISWGGYKFFISDWKQMIINISFICGIKIFSSFSPWIKSLRIRSIAVIILKYYYYENI